MAIAVMTGLVEVIIIGRYLVFMVVETQWVSLFHLNDHVFIFNRLLSKL